jgi:hypothetical protein
MKALRDAVGFYGVLNVLFSAYGFLPHFVKTHFRKIAVEVERGVPICPVVEEKVKCFQQVRFANVVPPGKYSYVPQTPNCRPMNRAKIPNV